VLTSGVAVAGVVVGMAGAAGSDAVIRWAAGEAVLRGAALHLVHAWRIPVDLSLPLPADLLPHVPDAVTSTAAQGNPAEVLLRQQPDLLVLGGHTGSPRVSHVAKACLRDATCPVAVVPDAGGATTGRVVVAVCGTEASSTALRWAESEVRLRAAHLIVTYVWQPPVIKGEVLHSSPALPEQGRAAEDRLRAWVHESLGREDVELQTARGGPLDVLLKASEEADLLVVGRSRLRSVLGRVTHASLSNDLGGLAPCPVVVVPDVHRP
jgi:nucleotide-binding universal stress UspA family protein